MIIRLSPASVGTIKKKNAVYPDSDMIASLMELIEFSVV